MLTPRSTHSEHQGEEGKQGEETRSPDARTTTQELSKTDLTIVCAFFSCNPSLTLNRTS